MNLTTPARISAGLLSQRHQDHITDRGFSIETAEAFGLKSLTADEMKEVLHKNFDTGGIGFPYLNPETREVRRWRVRPDKAPMIDGKPAKYLQPGGQFNMIFVGPDATAESLQGKEPLFATEGEFKTMAAFEFGVGLTVGLSGVWGFRTEAFRGNKSIPIPDLDLINFADRRITIIFDSDVSVNASVKAARHDFGVECYRRGAECVSFITLPSNDGKTVGLDDYLFSHDLEALWNLEDFEIMPTTAKPPFTHPLSHLLEADIPESEWAIVGYMPMHASGWRIAPPKAGKSFGMLEEAYCLATGTNLFHHYPIPHKRRVLVIEEEDSGRRIKSRLEKVITAYGGTPPDDEYFRYSIKSGVRFDDPDWQEILEHEINEFRPDFIFCDVFTRLHESNVNAAEEMAPIVQFWDRTAETYQTAWVILHHNRKSQSGGSSDGYDAILGSRVLGGFAEMTVFLKPTKEKGVLDVTLSLKDEPESELFLPEFRIKLVDHDEGGTSYKWLGEPPERGATSSRNRANVLAWVLENSDHEGVTTKEIAIGVGLKPSTVRDHANALCDDEELIRRNRGRGHVFVSPEYAENQRTDSGEADDGDLIASGEPVGKTAIRVFSEGNQGVG